MLRGDYQAESGSSVNPVEYLSFTQKKGAALVAVGYLLAVIGLLVKIGRGH